MIENESLQNKKPSRVALVDWGSLMSLVADELATCEGVLNWQRRSVLQMRQQYYASDKPSEVGFMNFEDQLCNLKNGIQYVRHRLAKLKPKLFNDVISDAIHHNDEEEFPDSEFDEE